MSERDEVGKILDKYCYEQANAGMAAFCNDDPYSKREALDDIMKIVSEDILDIIFKYGGIDGSHHKTWVIDQIVRKLTQDKYDEWVVKYKDGEDGPESYDWDEGIAP